ncbi:hypothetical protein AGRA3207_003004 [Actinomadura graeca]|uniref:Uncharacterized protein n=1 Tax=Actinomadura graeca TaxID=2750812 RepID=A0ABX8QTK9_9ACTN|nr:hypothetical protein [Actinomadura graeca]QXJ22065.1 hypothetical protein AGRA3207_003004 [Actinomadura graeca]
MPSRILVLITATAAAAMALSGLAGDPRIAAAAGAPPPGDDAPAAADPPPAPAKDPRAPSAGGSSGAKDGTDLTACLDAECDVEVQSGQQIKIDKQYGADSVGVKRNGSQVTLTVHRGSAKMVTMLDAGAAHSSSTFNDLVFQPRLGKNGALILTISRT